MSEQNNEWVVYEEDYNDLQDGNGILVFAREDGESYDICSVLVGDGMHIQDAINNAHLIAASPSMYDVLKAISTGELSDGEMQAEVAAVIAKAEGQ